MFNIGSRLTNVKSVVESADSRLESADSIASILTLSIQQKSVCGYGP